MSEDTPITAAQCAAAALVTADPYLKLGYLYSMWPIVKTFSEIIDLERFKAEMIRLVGELK